MTFVDFSSRFKGCIRREKLDPDKVFTAMKLAVAAWGQPHLHTGRGIRRISANTFECRLDLDTRLVFSPHGDALRFDFAGNHDQVRAYLKNRR